MSANRFSKLQKDILALLNDEGPIQTQAEIARKVGATQSSVSRSIRKLEEDNLVTRRGGYQLVQPDKISTYMPVPESMKNNIKHMSTMLQNYGLPPQRKLSFLAARNREFAAVFEQSDALSKRLSRTMKMLHPLQDIMAQNEELMRTVSPMLKRLDSQMRVLQPIIRDIIPQITVEEIDNRIQAWESNIRKANQRLMEHGWIFTPSMPMNIVRYVNEEADVETVINGLVNEYFTNELCSQLVDDLFEIDVFEKRREAIEEALSNHCDGRYYTAIPTFLAQMDGAYAEVFTNYLFQASKRKGAKRLRTDEDRFGDAIIDGLEKFLYEQVAQSTSVHDDVETNLGDHILCRNAVMHGLYLGYGTKENSIKTILLMDFTKFVIESHRRAKESNGD